MQDFPIDDSLSRNTKKKVLLMGKSASGKTSMRSIVFANFFARETLYLDPTMDIDHANVRFLGNFILNLWDCGGQENFMENYFVSQREHIFRDVEVLIYVFDIESHQVQKDFEYYRSAVEAIAENSPEAKIFCLIHKMDLIPEDKRASAFAAREREISELTQPLACVCFATSIWDETLFQAWSNIVYTLVPHVKVLEGHLRRFAELCDADEVILFEQATFLMITHAERKALDDVHRHEKISNIVKQFKLGCIKLGTQFSSMEIRKSSFAAFLDHFTPYTFVLVISSDPTVESAAMRMNIQAARASLEGFLHPQ